MPAEAWHWNKRRHMSVMFDKVRKGLEVETGKVDVALDREDIAAGPVGLGQERQGVARRGAPVSKT